MTDVGSYHLHGGTNNRFLPELRYSLSAFPEKGNDKVTSQERLSMANDKVADSGAVLLQEIETVGFYLGPILLVISLFLMFRGHEKLYVVAGITGAGIGYILTPMVHSQLQNGFEIEIRLLYVLMAMVLIAALLLAFFVQYSLGMMAVISIYVLFSSLFKFLVANGYEIVEGNEISGLMAIGAFFLTRAVRGILPLFVSALLGSLGLMASALLLSGSSITLLSASNTSTILIACVLFVLSFSWQYRVIRKKKAKEKKEANPEIPEMTHVGSGNRMVSRRRRAGDLPDLRDFS